MREVNQIPVMVLTCGRGQGLWLQGAQTGPSGWLGGVSVGGGKGHGLKWIRRLALYFQSSDCASMFTGSIRQNCNKLLCSSAATIETRDERHFAIVILRTFGSSFDYFDEEMTGWATLCL